MVKIRTARRVFPEYTRKMRRKLTLKRAKEIAKERGLPRYVMFKIRDDLMRNFPKGTIDD